MLNDTVSYFSYLDVNKKIYYIKDMHVPEVIKRVMLCKRDDILSIKGLGALKIFNIYYSLYHEGSHTVNEIGLMCSRIDV